MSDLTFLHTFIKSELEDIVGSENVSIRSSDILVYGVDYFYGSKMWEDRGKRLPTPDIIVNPGTAEEISKVLRVSNYYKIPVTTWGGGSGSQGGALSVAGGILLDMKRMNKIINFDESNMAVTVETGMNFTQLEWFANERGYSLMHYPSSMNCATVGGFLAHRGIGVLSTKYGKIDDMCVNLEVVLPNGDIIHTSPVPKHACGPDIAQIFIGSEGTLGIISKATLRLYKVPETRRFRAFLFKNVSDGISCGREILRVIKPSIIRLYDEAETVSIIKDVIGFAMPGVFMNIAVEGLHEIVDIEERKIIEITKKYEAQDLGSEYGEKWWKNRVTFFYPGHALDLPKMYGTLDTVANYDNIQKIYWARKKAIEENFEGVSYIAHFSHWYEWGCMIYDRFIMDNPPQDAEECMSLHNRIWNLAVRVAAALI